MRVKYYAIVKDHLWFNFTKFNIQEPSWFTIIRHPLDLAQSHYSQCINGTARNHDFKGAVCNKKFRQRGAESFKPTWSECIAETEQTSSGGILELGDCVSEKSYSLLKYTCGQHPICRNRLDKDADARQRMVEFTKRRILFDYAAVGIMEELELSFSLFAKMMPHVFGLTLDIIHGQRNIGLRRIELLRILRGLRNGGSSNPIDPKNWSEQDLNYINKYFRYEMDVYEFARSIFWKRVEAYQIKRYIPSEDVENLVADDEDAREAAKRLNIEKKDAEIQAKEDWVRQMEETAMKIKANKKREEAAAQVALEHDQNYQVSQSIQNSNSEMAELAKLMSIQQVQLDMNAANLQEKMAAASIVGESVQAADSVPNAVAPNDSDNPIIQAENQVKLSQDLEAKRIYEEEMKKEQEQMYRPAYQPQVPNMGVLDPYSQQSIQSDSGLSQNLQNALMLAGIDPMMSQQAMNSSPYDPIPGPGMSMNPMMNNPMMNPMAMNPMGMNPMGMNPMMGNMRYREYL